MTRNTETKKTSEAVADATAGENEMKKAIESIVANAAKLDAAELRVRKELNEVITALNDVLAGKDIPYSVYPFTEENQERYALAWRACFEGFALIYYSTWGNREDSVLDSIEKLDEPQIRAAVAALPSAIEHVRERVLTTKRRTEAAEETLTKILEALK